MLVYKGTGKVCDAFESAEGEAILETLSRQVGIAETFIAGTAQLLLSKLNLFFFEFLFQRG